MSTPYKASEVKRLSDDDIYQLAYKLQIPQAMQKTHEELFEAIAAHLTGTGNWEDDLPAGGEEESPSNSSSTEVTVASGAYRQSMNVAGQSIARVLADVRPVWNIDTSALAYLNGQLVTNLQTIIQPGAHLEFTRPAGSKG